MEIRYYRDPETGLPHIYDHGVTEEEVRQVLLRQDGDDFRGKRNSRIRFGRTRGGRYLKVIYRPNEELNDVFVITAYELRGKAIRAFRRRQRRRRG